ncbi:MAG: hypothetical protein A2234_05585 [Elusimicrobia bacterium RIFOXYA2_FULL_58_8]|nr:MAG: hypothetical protein A2285_04700 [Elusimicrobia bacterium RIFOXYA12_FULL_57_11]OGS17280.1 MAG: hypothetical protein A2234_05585 [Elusimicrobia bacterium RIFOXYA2_FULL_58_8]
MFILKKIIAAFILPPGIFIVAAAGIAYYLRRRCRPAAVACAALAAGMWLVSATVFSDALLRPLEYAYSTPMAPAGDVIVVLGGGVYDAGGVFSSAEKLQPASLERASSAALLQRRTGLPVIISGGAVFSGISDADAAGDYLVELGIPEKLVIRETAARDTHENAVFTGSICAQRGYKRVILLTSAVHMPRAVYSFRNAGFTDIVPFPVSRTAANGGRRFFRDFLPGNSGASARALNEYIGLLFYRLVY